MCVFCVCADCCGADCPISPLPLLHFPSEVFRVFSSNLGCFHAQAEAAAATAARHHALQADAMAQAARTTAEEERTARHAASDELAHLQVPHALLAQMCRVPLCHGTCASGLAVAHLPGCNQMPFNCQGVCSRVAHKRRVHPYQFGVPYAAM